MHTNGIYTRPIDHMPPSESDDESDDDEDSSEDSDEASDDSDDESDEGDSEEDSEDSSGTAASAANNAATGTAASDAVKWWNTWKDEPRRAEKAAQKLADARVPTERYTSAHSIFRALESELQPHTPVVRLVRASFLVTQAKHGGVLARRQELPEEVFISAAALRNIHRSASGLLTAFGGLVPVVSVSACWLTPEHPDPQGEQLKAVGAMLEHQLALYSATAADGGRGKRC